MTPVEKLNRIKQSIGVNTIEKFPENVATEEVQHFMVITEYEFKNTNSKNRDALTEFTEQTTSVSKFESKIRYCSWVPKTK